ncbi:MULTISPECIES: c-type cytochrome biogenesis protein CcmI [Leisingera]|jgi:cytochrome c-type biogenesis protein CcmH|uniref:c-type cytochrome biogenesis protein CcmI n=1 Tax=Leisingera TaxID=191028 RepID=UPI001150763F|nr:MULTISPECIES: c-type cytochrome biogenesis protein CcmI [Leisingera]QDI76050.1 c-type cytochrome biogenesis protein CcmI [Leisingera aquaemixtae]
MVFWTVTALIAFSAALLLAMIIIRAREQGEPAAAYDLRVYRQQLREVDKDLARGVINEGDAERIRTEISRRILAADAQLQQRKSGHAQPKSLSLVSAGAIALLITGGTLGLYWQLGAPGYGDLGLKDRIRMAGERAENRPSQAEAEAGIPALPEPQVEEGYIKLVEQLRKTAGEREGDARGQALLAQHEANLGNFKAAYEAKANYIRLAEGKVNARDFTELAELKIMAAGGYVSPEAQTDLQKARAIDPAHGPARYYWGLMLGQIGRPDLAYREWAATLRDGPADAPWVKGIQGQIEEMAFRAGVEYRPIAPGGGTAPALPGPSAEDMAGASELSAEEQQEMIRGMVTRLSDRLASEGGSAEEWARLIGALSVLGETERARTVYAEARGAFEADAEALALLETIAAQSGIAE